MKLCYIATNYNNSHYSEKLLNSLEASIVQFPQGNIDLILVDNSLNLTEKNQLEQLKLKANKVTLQTIYSEKNVGYFSGLNLGIEKIRPEIYDYVLIGNNDIQVDEHLFQQLLKIANITEKYPVISPNIVTLDGVHQNPHVIRSISRLRELIYDLYFTHYYLAQLLTFAAQLTKSITDRPDEQSHETPQEVYQGYGACYILTPHFFKNFSNLWSPSILMFEEYFLSKQLSDKGFKIFYEPSIKVRHHCKTATAQLSSRFKWQLSKDSFRIYRKYVKGWLF